MNVKHKKSQQGFTLIEMSVVIIIIGLIIAGITKGQDLIESSKINATIAQITKYETSANSFQTKYGGLPGDFNKASIFIDSSLSDGNGDGKVLGGTLNNLAYRANGEPTEFWNHLSKAEMIEEQITQLDPTTNTNYATAGTHFPKTKLKKGGITFHTSGTVNTWYVGTENHFIYGAGAHGTAMAASEVYNIDNKLDDGMPGEGSAFLATYTYTNKYYNTSYIPVPYAQSSTCTEAGNGDDFVDPGENYNPSGVLDSCALTIKSGI